MNGTGNNEVRSGLPRGFEAAVALGALFGLLPVLLCTSLGIRLTSSGGVFFKQKRVGRGGKNFTLYKFRTMRVANSGSLVTSRNDSRITGLGRLLRKTKVDELPELWNILVGDMSFVGPRPEVPDFVALDDPGWQEVLKARPGLTDPVTLVLRNEEELLAEAGLEPEKYYRDVLQPAKVRGYLKYLRCRSSMTDIQVIWQTILAIVQPDRSSVERAREFIAQV